MTGIAAELSVHRFFADMDGAAIDVLAGCARNVVVPAGTALVREGNRADVFWAIRSGRASLGVAAPGRGTLVLETLHAGDILGWAWLFPPYRWHFDADALDEVHALVFDAACLRQKCDTDPALGFHLTQRFARVIDERLQATRLQLLDLYGHASER
ncbi:MAG: cyclic nucleotide-binding domain-containing protein [Candidatus Dormibacteraeota bacterium]|nr:cyclic nucleotide-binding domain-containing protein [Candidatus Dormibacteraeota bacterium]